MCSPRAYALWPATLEVKSTLTDRYQTTVAQTVCRALKLGKRDEIQYTIRPGGEVVLSRVEITEEDNPVLGQFLDFSVQRYCQPSRTAPDR